MGHRCRRNRKAGGGVQGAASLAGGTVSGNGGDDIFNVEAETETGQTEETESAEEESREQERSEKESGKQEPNRK